jgi:hypothetical protein
VADVQGVRCKILEESASLHERVSRRLGTDWARLKRPLGEQTALGVASRGPGRVGNASREGVRLVARPRFIVEWKGGPGQIGRD